jgi:hypothetical protein
MPRLADSRPQSPCWPRSSRAAALPSSPPARRSPQPQSPARLHPPTATATDEDGWTGHRRGLLDGPPPTEHRPARAPDFPRTAPPTGDPMRRQLTGGNTNADEDRINLPWFLTASHGRGGSHSPRRRGRGRGYPSPTPRPRLRPSMMSSGSQTRPAISRRLSSTTPTTPSSSAAATPSIPSSSVAGTATPSSSAQAQAQHTPHEAQVEGTDHVLIDDDVSVGGKRKLKSDVWLEFEDVIVGGKKKN